MIGVPSETQANLMASAIARLGVTRAAIVTGSGGLDEVSLDGPTQVRWVEAGEVRWMAWEAEEFGLSSVEAEDLRVSGPGESASRIRETFSGLRGPVRDSIQANSAAALLVAGKVKTLGEGVSIASAAIDQGEAAGLLERWARMSRGC